MPTRIDVASLRLPVATVVLSTGREVSVKPIDCGVAALLEQGPTMATHYAAMLRILGDDLTREEFDLLPPAALDAIYTAAGKAQVEAAEKVVGES